MVSCRRAPATLALKRALLPQLFGFALHRRARDVAVDAQPLLLRRRRVRRRKAPAHPPIPHQMLDVCARAAAARSRTPATGPATLLRPPILAHLVAAEVAVAEE